jgi:plasmid stabilization system protein ParE
VRRRVFLRPEARDDLREAQRWYESRSPGLGAEFLRSLEFCVARVEDSPDRFPVVDATTRRARLRRFPFALSYEIEDERILILAVWHHRRDPRGWRREG